MGSNKLTRAEQVGSKLFGACVVLWGAVWLYMAFVFNGTPEEEMWAPVAGFFMGLIFGGFASVVPGIYAGVALTEATAKPLRLKIILALSVLWFGSSCLVYIV